ncbi:ESX secretion-associated protein EspG [Nocardia sp. NPDC056064]|uniref:ESX secretion-associated protein EspG n=1 Tax=Nocardia sp. NPDC056064 TaxID=3345701 RepID=UPI0035DD5B62
MHEWHWEPDDFAALWLSDARDRFPRPLHYTSRFRYREEFETHCRSVRSRYVCEMEAIDLALNTLETAELRVEVSAETRSSRSGKHTHHRIVGVRNYRHAVIASQVVVDGTDGSISVRSGHPENLGKRIVGRIPSCGAGRHRAEQFYIRDLISTPDTYFVNVARNTPRERYQRFVDRPMTGLGSALLRTGSVHDRTDSAILIEWLDFADDGRYILRKNAERIDIRPGGRADLSVVLAQWIKLAEEGSAH